MTFAAALTAASRTEVDATLLIDGIPVLFGTRSGLTLTMADTAMTNPPAATMTSVNAILHESVALGESKLDYDRLLVPPGGASLRLRLSTDWNRYFERRRQPQPLLVGDITETATSLTLNNTAGLATGSLLYANRETMLVGTVASSTSLTGTTRNYCALPGSRGAVHQDGTTCGTTPRYLLGRLCELRVWLGGPGVSSTSNSQIVRYLWIASSPVYNKREGVWEIEFDDNMRMLDRKIAVGFRGAKCTLVSDDEEIGGRYNHTVLVAESPLREFATHSAAEGSLLFFAGSESLTDTGREISSSLADINGYSADNYPLITPTQALYRAGAAFTTSELTVRRVYAFRDYPMKAALQVLLSDRGDGNNDSTYDVLLGVTSTGAGATGRLEVGEHEIRMGAGVPAALVDLTTLTDADLLQDRCAGFQYVLGAKGEENLVDFLTEVAWALNGYWCLNSSQKLTFKRFTAAYASDTSDGSITETYALNDSDLRSVDSEEDVVHTLRIKCNYDFGSGDFKGECNAFYQAEKETFRNRGENGVLTLERRGLCVDMPGQDEWYINNGLNAPPATLESVRFRLDAMFARRVFGLKKFRVRLPFRFCTLVPGQRVTLTHSQLNNFAGTTVSGETYEVVGVNLGNLADGVVEVELHEVFSGKPINPTVEVSSWSVDTATLKTSAQWHADATPGRWFAVGWKVKILDYSASPPFSTVSNELTVAAVTDTTIQVTGTVGFTPAVNDILVSTTYDNATSLVANAAQSLAQQSYAFMCTSTFVLGSSLADPHRYG